MNNEDPPVNPIQSKASQIRPGYRAPLWHASQAGVGIVWLSMLMVVIGIFISIAASVAPRKTTSAKFNQNRETMELAAKAVEGFILANKRLPCPDTDNDGRENRNVGPPASCANARGDMPFLDLGLPNGEDAYRRDMAYVVYNNAANNATNLINDATTVGGVSDLGVFCTRLEAIANTADNATFLNISTASVGLPNTNNRPYALISAGFDNRDGDVDGDLFDGANIGNSSSLENPSRALTAEDVAPAGGQYNDQIIAPTFNDLMGKLGCQGRKQQTTLRLTPIVADAFLPFLNSTDDYQVAGTPGPIDTTLNVAFDGGNGTYSVCYTPLAGLITYTVTAAPALCPAQTTITPPTAPTQAITLNIAATSPPPYTIGSYPVVSVTVTSNGENVTRTYNVKIQ
ncbi:MAG: hypothetical protein HQL51_00275 [Magnetococcales bacterium]|nr:hypothetical protein [Magnetococcales bacterium]